MVGRSPARDFLCECRKSAWRGAGPRFASTAVRLSVRLQLCTQSSNPSAGVSSGTIRRSILSWPAKSRGSLQGSCEVDTSLQTNLPPSSKKGCAPQDLQRYVSIRHKGVSQGIATRPGRIALSSCTHRLLVLKGRDAHHRSPKVPQGWYTLVRRTFGIYSCKTADQATMDDHWCHLRSRCCKLSCFSRLKYQPLSLAATD
jgi:hypothetical protein